MRRHRDQSRSRSRRAGFTLIEVMMAILVFSIGVIGVFAMQIVAIQSNGAAQRSTEATMLAEFFIKRLRQDTTLWTSDEAQSLAKTEIIQSAVPPSGAPGWQVLTSVPVNMLGASKASSAGTLRDRAIYCVAFRLDWAVPNEVLTGAVRVYWTRSKAPFALLDDCLSPASNGLAPDDLDLKNNATRSKVIQYLNTYTVPVTLSLTHVEQ